MLSISSSPKKQGQARCCIRMDSGKAFDDERKNMPQLEAEMLFLLASIFHLSRGEPVIAIDLPHIPKEELNYPFAEYP